jgi:hypothetical protein
LEIPNCIRTAAVAGKPYPGKHHLDLPWKLLSGLLKYGHRFGLSALALC